MQMSAHSFLSVLKTTIQIPSSEGGGFVGYVDGGVINIYGERIGIFKMLLLP